MRKTNKVGVSGRQAIMATGLAIAAAGAGAIAALLLAPKSGRELRGDIKEQADDIKRRGREKLDETHELTRGKVNELKDRRSSPVETEEEKESIFDFLRRK